jgi:positive regulator of sigma E activity
MRWAEIFYWLALLVLALAVNLLRAYLKLDVPTIYVITGFSVLGFLIWWAFVRRKTANRSENHQI